MRRLNFAVARWPAWLAAALLAGAGPVAAQPSYEEDMARQRAEEQRIQEDWHQREMLADEEAEAEYEDEPNSYRGLPTPQAAESHMAVAWHFDTPETWGTAGHFTAESADNAVLGACKQTMGDGCMIASHWTNNSYIAIVADEFGMTWIKGSGKGYSAALDAAMKVCRANSTGCKLKQVIAETPLPLGAPPGLDLSDNYFPKGPVKRNTFALVAWPKQQVAAPLANTVWLASGPVHWRETREQLLAKCQQATGAECDLGQTAINGVLVRFTTDTGKQYWMGVASENVAPARMKEHCPKGAQCRIVELFDTAIPRSTTLDLDYARTPVRGFFSLASPINFAPGWNKLVLVTGQKDNAAAKAAAMQVCETSSKARCEPFLTHDDNGTDQFLAVYHDSAGNTRTYLGNAPANLEQRAAAACAKAQVTCTRQAIFDLAKPGTFTSNL